MRASTITLILIASAATSLRAARVIKVPTSMNPTPVTSDKAVDDSAFGNVQGIYTGIEVSFPYSSASAGTMITGIDFFNCPTGECSGTGNVQFTNSCNLSSPIAVSPTPPADNMLSASCLFSQPTPLGAGTPWYVSLLLSGPGTPTITIAPPGTLTVNLVSATLFWQYPAAFTANNGAESVSMWYILGGLTPPVNNSSLSFAGNSLNTSPIPASFKLVGAADFDNDGTPDLVWEDINTGQVTIWYFGPNSSVPDGVNFFNCQPTNSGACQSWAWANQASGLPGSTVVAVADMNEDGIPDLIWQNNTTGQVMVQYFSSPGNGAIQGSSVLSTNGYPGWTATTAADFNGDGVPDLVWENLTTRQVTVHYYSYSSGNNLDIGWNWLNETGVPGWSVVGATDVDANGTPDLIWQNNSTWQVTVNYYSYNSSSGPTYTGWNWIDSTGSSGWTAIAPSWVDVLP